MPNGYTFYLILFLNNNQTEEKFFNFALKESLRELNTKTKKIEHYAYYTLKKFTCHWPNKCFKTALNNTFKCYLTL